MSVHATIEDHFSAVDDSPEWVISLAEMIQRILGSSSAIASARAKDLSRLPLIGEAFESIINGWEILNTQDLQDLSPLQRETIEEVVTSILNNIHVNIDTARRVEL